MSLGREVGLGPGDIVLDQLPYQKIAQQPPHILAQVYCGQIAGWITIPLGMEVGLGPDHIVFDGHPFFPKGAQLPPSIFGPCLLWPNGWMGPGATWYRGRP